jgi:hypothetical protein
MMFGYIIILLSQAIITEAGEGNNYQNINAASTLLSRNGWNC